MRNNGDDRVGVPLRLKVESPVTIYSGLPNIIGLIIFLGPKRGVAKVLSQQANLLVKSFLHGSSSTVALNSPDAFTTLAFESGQHFGGTGKGPVDPALLEVVQSLRNGPVDNGFRREHNLALISLGFQKVADPDPDLLANALWDYDLVFIFDGDNGHR